ncbi:MAG: HEAT repeat domain-containing protein, partial [Planctomycetota bacterium]
MVRIFYTLIILAVIGLGFVDAERLKKDDAKAAKARLKEVKKDWKRATAAEKLIKLKRIKRENEKSVAKWLLDVVEDDDSDVVAARATLILAGWDEESDIKSLVKIYNKAKDPSRRAAILRWFGKFDSNAPLVELKKIGMTKDDSAVTATHALADVDITETWTFVFLIGQGSSNPKARIAAARHLLAVGDERGLEVLDDFRKVEEAAEAAHAAIGTGLEVEAVKRVAKLSAKTMRTKPGQTAYFYGSLLARITEPAAYEAVTSSAPGSTKYLCYFEYMWWLVGFNRHKVNVGTALDGIDKDTDDAILNGLRMLQRVSEKLGLGDAKDVKDVLPALLDHENKEVTQHALLAAAATRVIDKDAEKKIETWIGHDEPDFKAAALLAAGQMGMKKHRVAAINMLQDGCWYVQSAALDFLLRVRSAKDADTLLAFIEEQKSGRLFAEAIALLVDLTGQDHGDDLEKWKEWLAANKEFTKQKQSLQTLRGVP